MFCDLCDLKLSVYSLRTYPVFWILQNSLNDYFRNWNLSHSFTSEVANTHRYKQNDSWCWQFHFVHNINTLLYNSTELTLIRIVVCCNEFLPVSGICSERGAIWQSITSSCLNCDLNKRKHTKTNTHANANDNININKQGMVVQSDKYLVKKKHHYKDNHMNSKTNTRSDLKNSYH